MIMVMKDVYCMKHEGCRINDDDDDDKVWKIKNER